MVVKWVRLAAAAVLGYAVIVLGTTAVFEWTFGGIGFYKSSAAVLAASAIGAAVSGFCGGLTAGWVGRGAPLQHAAGVLVFLVIDTTYVLTSGISQDPAWYDLLGSLTLMISCLAGAHLLSRQKQAPPPGALS